MSHCLPFRGDSGKFAVENGHNTWTFKKDKFKLELRGNDYSSISYVANLCYKLAQFKLRIGFYIICSFRRLNCKLYFMYFNVTLFNLYLQQTFVYHLLELSEPQVPLVINLHYHQKSPYDLQSFGPRPLSWHSPNVHPIKRKSIKSEHLSF